jgi:type III pantothenate kinase
MLLVVDAGNTRTKWAHVDARGALTNPGGCANTEFSATAFKKALKGVSKVMIANVAGEGMQAKLSECMPQRVQVVFVKPQAEACNVTNRYAEVETLGVDRWASLVAAWHITGQPTVVVNAGTAVTIDALAKNPNKKGVFLGGTIMPGLWLMRESLLQSTAIPRPEGEGEEMMFPDNTRDAIQSGRINAVVGAILLMLKQLERHSAFLPRLVISGGDASKIDEALKPHLKRVIIAENLVMQGLVLLEKEFV